MKTILKGLLLSTTLLLTNQAQANFDFGECQGSGTFEQQIESYNGDYEKAVYVGTIPAGIKGLHVELNSVKDVDIRLYGENNDKIVHWPYGIMNRSYAQTKLYKSVPISYSGYNGVGGERGHEYIEVNGTTPTTMTMKAFGYKAGYATVNYSWTGKEGCSIVQSGTGHFNQNIPNKDIALVGSIPKDIDKLEVNLTSDKDIDIQLYGVDGTAIIKWPDGLLNGSNKQEIDYHGMHIEWSGYNGVNGHKGHEYIKLTGKTTEQITMKVYGYEAGEAEVIYSWGGTKNDITIDKWTRTNPGAGGAFSMIGATAHGKYLVAGSDLSGVYISEDNGTTWYAKGETSGLPDTSVQALGFDTTDDKTFYVGTTNGVYKTINGGKQFISISPSSWSTGDGVLVESIVAGEHHLYVTYHTWTNKNHPSVISVSSNKGETWETLPPIVDANVTPVFHVIKLLIHPNNDRIVYALSGNSRYGCSPAKAYKLMYDSTGKPNGWEEISQQPIADTRSHNTINTVNSTIGIFDIEINIDNTNILYMSTFNPKKCPYEFDAGNTQEEVAMWEYVQDSSIGNIYKSTNRGDSFTSLSTDESRRGMIFSVGGRKIHLADIIHFEDAWNERNDPYGTVAVWEYTPNNQTWQRYDNIQQWNIGPNNNPSYSFGLSYYGISKTLTKDLFNPNNIYGTYGFNGASFDGGKTFTAISTTHQPEDTWHSTGLDNINGTSINVSNSNKNIVYMGGYDIGLWVSKNHGESWHMNIPQNIDYKKYVWGQKYDGSVYAYPGGSNVATLVVDSYDEKKVWATFSAAQDFTHEGVDEYTGLFKSENYGESWQLITGGEMPDNGRMYGLSIDKHSPAGNRTLFMTVNGYVFKSTDDGEHWYQKTSSGNGICGLINVMPVKVGTENGCGLKVTAIDSNDSNLVYSGGESGLWKSTDGGENWSQIGGIIFEANRTRALNMNRDIVPTYNEHQDDDSKPYAWEGVFDIKPDPSIAKRVYVTVYGAGYIDKGGLYRSDDAGESWQKLTLPSLHGINPDKYLRGIAIDPNNSNLLFVSSSHAYHSGGEGNTSVGILYSTNAGATWQYANNNMAWNFGGMMEIENTTQNPRIWAWSPGTGVQYAEILP